MEEKSNYIKLPRTERSELYNFEGKKSYEQITIQNYLRNSGKIKVTQYQVRSTLYKVPKNNYLIT